MPVSPLRVFGYGSLIFRPDLPFARRDAATLRGWARRFWQGSPDHRGTERAPGRVVTLVPDAEAVCVGMLYEVPETDKPAVLTRLDHRERAGFDREVVPVVRVDGVEVEALLYRATEANPHFLGPAPLGEMARHVLSSHGRSGANVDYVLGLADALAELGAADAHVEALAAAVRRGG